ncbi:hypothetical protein MNEG_12631 [Monoraphidium neglectum]|uniref:GAF domain-containing protein n=1 Tax=Monoraphidium neglectum TaxID=145388 RepID=A0A0D2KHN2_9CHLO|nr:hypothetical protein MNEG_12631 [Monoraphidium neglectum]KIY95328.1 hypothetical protein MNEG_12631 [Monoraphidium neglectum]|eukprot:XP_013894348.1 hypothetical protein MNEG_12631 [Monoraphidium neglectum]
MGCISSKPAVLEAPVIAEKAAASPGVEVEKPGVEVPASGGREDSSQLLVVLNEVILPEDEDVRWESLNSYNILDTVPISMITFVDKDRVWLKSVQGLSGFTEVDRRCSICAWALLSRHPEALVIPDLRLDIRFKDYPIVTGWPHARSYAAAPLVTSGGQRLGTL